jgi:hypothetical protein
VCGESPELGRFVLEVAPVMKWSTGHVWRYEGRLPAGGWGGTWGCDWWHACMVGQHLQCMGHPQYSSSKLHTVCFVLRTFHVAHWPSLAESTCPTGLTRFKLLLKRANGGFVWEEGPDRNLQVGRWATGDRR